MVWIFYLTYKVNPRIKGWFGSKKFLKIKTFILSKYLQNTETWKGIWSLEVNYFMIIWQDLLSIVFALTVFSYDEGV